MSNQTIEGFRLSPLQQQLVLRDAAGPAFSSQCRVRIEGPLCPDRLRQAAAEVVSRHEILRTTFQRQPGMRVPIQVVEANGSPAWREEDLRDESREAQEARIEAVEKEERGRPFDLQRGPLLRLSLLRRSGEMHVLVLTVPTLCGDSESLANLTREISHSYAGSSQPGEADAEEPLQYADLSEWQHELLESEELESREGREFWSRRAVASTALTLPLEQEDAVPGEFDPAEVALVLEPEVGARIAAIETEYQVETGAFLLACWQSWLWRLTGQPEITAGVVLDGRRYDELKEALGLFARCVPLSSSVSGDMPLLALAERTGAILREAARWQEYFGGLPAADASDAAARAPDFACLFSSDALPESWSAAGVTFSIERQRTCSERFKLQLCCHTRPGAFGAEIRYDPRLFSCGQAERLARQFETLLAAAVRQPETPIRELPILPEVERRLLLEEFNQTESAIEVKGGVCQWFEEQARHVPDRPALAFEGRELTYRELNEQANRWAHFLCGLGVGPEARVAICAERSPEMVIGLLAVLKAGGAYLPLDPALPAERLAFMLEDSEAPVLLTQERLRSLLPAVNARMVCLDRDRESLAEESADNPAARAAGSDAAYVIYTSGSTGRPKGVVVEHRHLANYVRGAAERLALPAGASFAMVSTFAADLGHTVLFPSLCTGGTLHVIASERVSDPEALADYFQRYPIDCLKIVPSHLAALLAGACPERLLPRQRLVLGGEACRWDLVERLGQLAPHCRMFNHYGPTETTVGAAVYPIQPGQRPTGARTAPLGRPLPNYRIYVLDEMSQPVPVGVAGELVIGGEGVARGYLNRLELTEERFRSDPFDPRPGARLYRTGDRARWLPDGNLEFLGRLDDQIKLHGFRIELGEIEAVLRQHPEVRDCVLRAPDEGEPGLAAYVVPERHPAPAGSELRSFLRDFLPEFMIPAAFVPLERLPLTANGKVDRRALPEPERALQAQRERFEAPRGTVEQALAAIWRDVLRLPQVGIHDNFFDLGGDSILSIQIIARAGLAGIALTPKQLFQHQTIAELAAAAGTAPRAPAEQGLVSGPVPLTPIQQRLLEQEPPEPHHWNMALLLDPPEPLDEEALRQAVQHLIQHHDALRLRFVRDGSGWRQFHAPPGEAVSIGRVDASDSSLAAVQRSLDLAAGPLLRVALLERGPDAGGPQRGPGPVPGQQLLLALHHLVVDGVSWRILLEDLWTAYQQIRQGEAVRLPPKSSSFQQWALHLQQYAGSAEAEAELSYWLGLEGQPDAERRGTALPVDADGANTEGSARTFSLQLGEAETQALLQKVPAAYHTQINDALLTALVRCFSRWTGSASLRLDLEGHGREEIGAALDLSRTVGWFTAVFPVLLKLDPAAEIGAALKAVKEQLRQVPQHGIGYGVLRYLHPDPAVRARLAALPAAEISFNYLGQFDAALPEGWRMQWEGTGPLRSPAGARKHRLNVIGLVSEGRLQLDWVYSEKLHGRATIERWAADYLEELRSLIAHCQSDEAGGFTPSDFPLLELNEQDLSQILSQVGGEPLLQPGPRAHE